MSENGQTNSAAAVVAGIYHKCKVDESDVQVGENEKSGTLEMVLQVYVPDLNRSFSTVLYFSENAAQYSFERLRACGWVGDDLSNLKGIGSNEIDFSIAYDSTYDGTPRMKTQIMSGGGRINTSKPTDLKTFAARVAMLTGKGKMPGGASPPPFG